MAGRGLGISRPEFKITIGVEGWGRGSGGKVFVHKHEDLSSDLLRPCKDPGVVCVYNCSTRKSETRGSLEFSDKLT